MGVKDIFRVLINIYILFLEFPDFELTFLIFLKNMPIFTLRGSVGLLFTYIYIILLNELFFLTWSANISNWLTVLNITFSFNFFIFIILEVGMASLSLFVDHLQYQLPFLTFSIILRDIFLLQSFLSLPLIELVGKELSGVPLGAILPHYHQLQLSE